jgi:hypothetical protein
LSRARLILMALVAAVFFPCAGCHSTRVVSARPAVTVTVETGAGGAAIPDDFIGLSFEMQNVLADARGRHIFSPDNKPLLALVRTLGIKNIRLGGNMADRPSVPMPGPADIDSLFAFAKAAGARVIYTLRLREGDVKQDASLAQYIEERYQPLLDCFAIGNEPDYYKKVYPRIKDYPSYRDEWKKFATAISAAAPGAKFCGPCAGNFNDWSRQFADDFAQSGLVKLIAQHDYPGGSGRRATNAAAAREAMLSPAWREHYQKFYENFATAALSNGLPYRLEEANNYSDGGATNASDTFASALWSLEYLHWWAAHGAGGINIHGRRGVRNAVLNPLPAGQGWNIHPVGYGLLAFNLGGHGRAEPVALSKPDSLNLTAYAVRGTDELFVTILNPGARDMAVTVVSDGISGPASVSLLTVPNGGLAATTGITVGGASVSDDGSWAGEWTPLSPAKNGRCAVAVSAASAAIVKMAARQIALESK